MMSTTIQIEVGPETLRAIAALTEQISMSNTFLKALMSSIPPETTDEDWLTLKEISQRYKISPSTVYRRVKEGSIKRLELGGRSPRYKFQDYAPTA